MSAKDIISLSRQTGISIKELNRLNRNEWYHGTTVDGAENIRNIGVIANYNLGSELDFGMGFYLTDTYERAESYISRVPVLKEGKFVKASQWAIIKFEFNPFNVLFSNENEFKYRNFPKHDVEFAAFSFDNRINNVYNEKPHGYDIIWGVMSDNLPGQIILDYKNGKISYDKAIELLQKPNSMKQLYIGNQEICDMLTICKIEKKEEK